jgi:integrase/recombinase XerC
MSDAAEAVGFNDMRTEPTTALAPRGSHGGKVAEAAIIIASGQRHTAETIVRAWFAGKSGNTIRAYQRDLEAFARFLSLSLGIRPSLTAYQSLDRLFAQSAPSAHEIVLAFRAFLLSANLASGTINRHLATLRSVSKLARMLGLSAWSLEMPGLKGEKRRKTNGPPMEVVSRMLAVTSGEGERETRDYAILVTFVCLGLRVSELCGLTREDTDLVAGNTWIRGKGRRERELVPCPPLVCDAVKKYLAHRGDANGPLFQTLGHRGKSRNGALESRSVLRIVRTLGRKVGQHVWCHGLRHTSITKAVELGQNAGIGLEKIKVHSRHRSIATLMTYVDEHDRAITQRSVSELIAKQLTTNRS